MKNGDGWGHVDCDQEGQIVIHEEIEEQRVEEGKEEEEVVALDGVLLSDILDAIASHQSNSDRKKRKRRTKRRRIC